MADTRLPDRWLIDRRLHRTPLHFQSFVSALMWSVANRTDGVIDQGDLELIPHFDCSVLVDFLSSELFIRTKTGWVIPEFEETQTSAEELHQLAHARKLNALRQAKWRAKQAEQANQDSNVTNNVTVTVTETVTKPVTSQVRRGEEVVRDGEPSLTTPTNSPSPGLVVTNRGTSLAPEGIEQIRVLDDARKLVHDAVPKTQLRTRRTRDGLYAHAQILLNDGAEPGDVSAVLSEWAATSDVYPGQLPHMYTELIKRRSGATRNGHRPSRTEEKTLGWMALGRQSPNGPKGIEG